VKDDAGGDFTNHKKTPPASFSSHYSYTAYADPAMADSFDRRRFGGPIGELVREREERTLLRFMGDVAGRTVLDVGTGTGRAALVLARRGARVTGVDASTEMLAVAEDRAAREGVRLVFKKGDAHALPFADREFDAAVSLRVIMHTPDWRGAVAELCRVSRSRIVFDYPALASAAAGQALVRRVLLALGVKVEAYRVFRDGDITREVERHGFRIVDRERHFALPIGLHKSIGSRAFTERVERALDAVALRAAFGSPVTLVADRMA
jgi:2-polyprenyl-3-methyl-5-hydroxy-6-metoxy-1,4-benzoquinol methylase